MPRSRSTSATGNWRPQALSTLCLLPARIVRLLTIVDLVQLNVSFCLLSSTHSSADGGHYIVFVVRHNHRCDVHKLSCLFRCRKVCKQSIVGTWQDVVKNHSREPCFRPHNQPRCYKWAGAPTRKLRSHRYACMSMNNRRLGKFRLRTWSTNFCRHTLSFKNLH